MPLEFKIDSRRQLVRVHGRGVTGMEPLVELMAQLLKDEKYRPKYDVLVDFSRLSYTPSVRELRKFGEVVKETRQSFQGRVAFITADPLQLRLGRFASALAAVIRFDLAVFETETAALGWLGRGGEAMMDELRNRIFKILGTDQLASLATVSEDGRPWVRYVTTRASDDLKIRFATPANSRKIRHVSANPGVHLTLGGKSLAEAESWVQVEGTAVISEDEAEKRAFWNDGLRAYFDGPEDPRYVLVVITPLRIEYMTMSSLKPEVLELS